MINEIIAGCYAIKKNIQLLRYTNTLLEGVGYMKEETYGAAQKAPFSFFMYEDKIVVRIRNVEDNKTYVEVTDSISMAIGYLNAMLTDYKV